MSGRCLFALAAVAALVGSATSVAVAQGGGSQPKATEVGVTADEIRIAVVADVENPLAPGLFKGAVDAVQGFGRYINAHGGLAGRKLVVDFLDSKLSADEARNAVIEACQEDFALIGTSALFLNNVDDMLTCPDESGAPTGLPDVPGVATELVHACSPVSFPVNPPAILCSTKDDHPQTYRGNIGALKYYRRHYAKNPHGVTVNTNDLQSAHNAIAIGYELAKAGGMKADAEFNVSARSPQSAYTPIVEAIKDSGANIVLDQLNYASNVALRKEAKLQGVTSVKVWSCPVSCYEKGFLEQGGADVEGHFVPLTFLPFGESATNRMLASFLKYTGRDKATGLGASAWAAGVLLRDAVKKIVAGEGVNGVTRGALLDAIRGIHDFDADGMFGHIDVGAKFPNICGVIMQVRGGRFVRLEPKQPGTLRCDRQNIETIKIDLLKGGSG
ncbi:MAG TPA: ABC transporter substrate-binding protein [Acidimicrobiia bacterium]|jgi:ABC-type branched-subunit amino acid transport system substrate-binding protein